jgi:hypothetical protein
MDLAAIHLGRMNILQRKERQVGSKKYKLNGDSSREENKIFDTKERSIGGI